jgi:RecA/RadA recombinase
MAKDEKELRKLMDVIDEINPYSTYLSESQLSRIDEWIDTGSLALNAIISGSLYKGIPVGRITQIAGPSGCGKTFFIQKIIANAQKMGKQVIVFDSENAIDPDDAPNFGIDPTKVKYITALTLENTRNAINRFLKGVADSGRLGEFVIIMDNIASMDSELNESRMDKASVSADMGTFAKSVKSLLKTCTKWSAITKTTIVFTNEIYDNPNVMYPTLEKDMPGGRAAVYKPTVTIQIGRKPTKDDEGKTIDNTLVGGQKGYSGVTLTCRAVKNRIIKPFMEVELFLSFATGLDRFYGLLELMKGLGVVVLDGKTYKDWNGEQLGYYKNWRKDKELWKKLLPKLDQEIADQWSYKKDDNPEEDLEDDEYPSEEDEQDSQPEETALDKLKTLKKKVSSKLDKLEEIDGAIGLAGDDNC